MALILASASPRRAELLRAAGFMFSQVPVNVDETMADDERPGEAVVRLAEAKAVSVLSAHPDHVLLGADTMVVLNGQALGKPADESDATRMLRLLSGQTHEVLTGICLCRRADRLVHLETTHVRMAGLGDDEIAWYVRSGEPLDKAGGYAIQGLASRFVESIEGSYSNVVGLPISSVCALLRTMACDILDPKNFP